MLPVARRLRFGPFEMDPHAGELRNQGQLVHLRHQSFRLLVELVTRAGQLVTRDELRERLWDEHTFVNFDQGLNHCVREVRAALGDEAGAACYLETMPRRGYRFVAPVEIVGEPAAPADRPRRWAVALTLAIATALLATNRRTEQEPSGWSRLTFRRGTVTGARFTASGAVVMSAAFDGDAPALLALEPGGARRLGDAARIEAVTGTGEVGALLTRGGPLLTVPLNGGPSRERLDRVVAADARPDGTAWAAVRAVPGRGQRLFYPLDRELGPVRPTSLLRLSPDGRLLALVQHPDPAEDAGFVAVLDRDGREVARSRHYNSVEGLAWPPDGRAIWFTASDTGSDTAVRALDLRSAERILIPAAGRLVVRDVDRQGRVLLERTAVRAEVRYASASREHDLSWQDGTVGVALTAVGDAALLHEMGEAAGPAQAVLLRATDGAPPIRLGSGRPSALSPDGLLAAVVPAFDRRRIDLLPTRPGPARSLRFEGIAEYHWMRWTADGRRVLFLGREHGRRPRVFVGSPTGGIARPLTPEGRVTRPELVAPDGRFLATCGDDGVPCIRSLDADPVVVRGLDDRQALAMHPSGDLLVQARGARYPVRIERLEPRTGSRTRFADLAPPDLVGATPVARLVTSADGRSLAYTFTRRLSELYLVPRVD